MSHIKNVEAFEKLVGICAGYGAQYNPAQRNLQVQNLSSLLSSARSVLQETGAAKTNHDNATNAREVAYTGLSQLGLRILSEMRSGGVLSQTVDDANGMVRKLTGRHAVSRAPVSSEAVTAALPTSKVPGSKGKRTAIGLDHGSMAQYFEKLLQTVVAEQAYQPSTTDLKVAALDGRLQTLRTENAGVVQAYALLSEARKKRNALLYGGSGNLFNTAQAVKQQVRATFGSNSAAFREVRKIRFTKPVK